MTTKLDQRPGQVYDPEDNSHNSTGKDPYASQGLDQLESFANDPKNKTKKSSSLAEKELDSGTANDGHYGSRMPGEELFNEDSQEKKRRAKDVLLHPASIFGVPVGVFMLFNVLFPTIPALKIVTFGNILRQNFAAVEQFGDMTTGSLTSARRFALAGTVQSTRLGFTAGRYADVWEARMFEKSGLRQVYSTTTGRIVGFEVADPLKAYHSGSVDRLKQRGLDVDPTANKNRLSNGRRGVAPTGDIISLRDESSRSRRSISRSVTNSLGYNKVSSFIGSRTLIKLGGVTFTPKNFVTQRTDNLLESRRDKRDAKKEAKEAHAKRMASGVTESGVPRQISAEIDPETNEPRAGAGQVADDYNDTNRRIQENPIDSNSKRDISNNLTSRLASPARAAGGAVAVVALMCAVRAVGDGANAVWLNRTFFIPMRVGFEAIAMGARLLALQDLNVSDIEYMYELMSDPDTGESVFDAALVNTMTQPSNVSAVDGTYGVGLRSEYIPSDNGGKPELFQVLDKVPGVSKACGALDGVGNFVRGIPLIGNAFEAAEAVSAAAINGALQAATGQSADELMLSLVNWVGGGEGDAVPVGSLRGNLSVIGSVYGANTQFSTLGGVPMTPTEIAEVDNYLATLKKDELRNKSFFARMLDIESPESLLSVAIMNTPATNREVSRSLSNIASNPLNPLISPVKNLAMRGAAASSAEKTAANFYKVERLGYSLAELNHPALLEPEENASIVENEETFAGLTFRFSKCFPAKISLPADSDSINLTIESYQNEAVNQFTLPDDCRKENLNNEEKEAYLRYRAYLGQVTTMKSLECLEREQTACGEIGISMNTPLENTADNITEKNTLKLPKISWGGVRSLLSVDHQLENVQHKLSSFFLPIYHKNSHWLEIIEVVHSRKAVQYVRPLYV